MGFSGVTLNPTENVYVIQTAADLPDELDRYRLYHLVYMGNTLWYYNGSELTPVSGDFYLEIAKGNVSGHSIVHKFGSDDAIPNGTSEIISTLSGVGYGIFLAAGSTMRVKAGGAAADTLAGTGARKVIIQGIIASTLLEGQEEVDLAGASASASTTASFLRVHRAWVSESGSGNRNAGNIVVENTAGTQDMIQIDLGVGQSLHAVFSSPTGHDMYLLSARMTVDANKAVDFTLYKREQYDDVSVPVESFRAQNYWNGIDASLTFRPVSPTKISSLPCDIWMEASGAGGTASVSADLEILLVAQ